MEKTAQKMENFGKSHTKRHAFLLEEDRRKRTKDNRPETTDYRHKKHGFFGFGGKIVFLAFLALQLVKEMLHIVMVQRSQGAINFSGAA